MNGLHPIVTQFHRNCETVESRKKRPEMAAQGPQKQRDSGKLTTENQFPKNRWGRVPNVEALG
jgi:hypothetical protein